jgi:hypothetical protein
MRWELENSKIEKGNKFLTVECSGGEMKKVFRGSESCHERLRVIS